MGNEVEMSVSTISFSKPFSVNFSLPVEGFFKLMLVAL